MNEMDVVDERSRGDCKQGTGVAAAAGVNQELVDELSADYKEWTRRDVKSMIPLTITSAVFLAASICLLIAVCS